MLSTSIIFFSYIGLAANWLLLWTYFLWQLSLLDWHFLKISSHFASSDSFAASAPSDIFWSFSCGVNYTIFHFLLNNISIFIKCWLIGVEAVGKKYRVVCGFIYQLIFTVGNALLGLVAYYVRDWKTLQLIVSVPMFTFVAFYWYRIKILQHL